MEEETLATYRNNKRVSALGHPCPVQDKNRGDIIGGGVLHLEAFLCSLGLGWPWGLMTVGFIAIFFFCFLSQPHLATRKHPVAVGLPLSYLYFRVRVLGLGL